jgi:uncharacterized protein
MSTQHGLPYPKSRLGSLAALPIRFYRRFLSPLKPPTCRFHPTCSAYGVEALQRHGLLRGSGLLCWRLLRCQPFCKGGHDPVPPRGAKLFRYACDRRA